MRLCTILFSLILVMTFSRNAYAYLDPGTGSYMLQILVAAFAATFFAIKHYWMQIKAFINSIFKRNEKSD